MLKKKSNKKVKTIVSVDNYTQSSYALKGKSLVSNEKLTFKNNLYFTTYLANKDMIVAPIEIGGGIADEDLDGALENRAYEELGLDPTVEYIIHHHEIPHDGDGKMFQLFIIEMNKYIETFSQLQSKIKYIDYIIPAPLLYKALYNLELVESKGVHCYLYFSKYDTFLTFYKNGEYLYSKSINYSFEQIYNRYCEMVGDTVDENKFYKILQKEGMKATEIDYQQNIMKLFGEIFISINDIVIYTKRAYNLEVIDQMFVGSSFGPIVGLEDYAQNYLGLYSSALEFDFDISTNEWFVDQLHYMMIVAGTQYAKDFVADINFTTYHRPPPFFKRHSGQFVSATLLATAFALTPSAYYYVIATANETRNNILQEEESKLSTEATKYKRIIKKKREEIAAIDKKIKYIKEKFLNKEKTLMSIYNKKVFYRLKSEQLRSFSDDLAANGVNVVTLESNADEYMLSLVAPSDKNITQLITYISDKYSEEISSIDIEVIEKDQNAAFYKGVLKVVLQ